MFMTILWWLETLHGDRSTTGTEGEPTTLPWKRSENHSPAKHINHKINKLVDCLLYFLSIQVKQTNTKYAKSLLHIVLSLRACKGVIKKQLKTRVHLYGYR